MGSHRSDGPGEQRRSAGAAWTALSGLRRVRPGPVHAARAVLGGVEVAKSSSAVIVEGNVYFERADVHDGVLEASSTRSLCPWKGVASYYDVRVGDQLVHDGAWTYRHPLPTARRIRDRVSFRNGVRTTVDEEAPRPLVTRGRRRAPG